ncbi:MAG: hypothetical protein M0C28_21100 [Candidatus Moduliflexus flocculans]|nr:hypothetical protein [Candidatus Moduliflexus flocculans]
MDNRKDKRFSERNTVFIKSTSEAAEALYGHGINAHTHDLSLSGARICTPTTSPSGASSASSSTSNGPTSPSKSTARSSGPRRAKRTTTSSKAASSSCTASRRRCSR